MIPEEVTAIISRREDSRHQFKRDFANTESTAAGVPLRLLQNLNLAPRPATADLRATLLTWGPIVAGLAFL